MSKEEWQRLIATIAADRTSGAIEIARNCVSAFGQYAHSLAESETDAVILKDLRSTCVRLLRGQPSMAPVLRVCNEVLLAIEDTPSTDAAVATLRSVSAALESQISNSAGNIVEQFVAHTEHVRSLITLSYSGSIIAGLQAVGSKRTALEVIVLESRPAKEGRKLAKAAADAGLNVTLVVDAAAYSEMMGADMWVSGADALLVDGAVNKIGTAMLAAAARLCAKPGLVLADSLKIWPADVRYPAFPQQDPDEVWSDKPEGVTIRNSYFELVPWGLVSGIICENGLATPSKIIESANSLATSNYLKEYFV